MLGRLLRNDWPYILILINGFVLRRYKSRVAATIFILAGLYGTGLGLYMIWTMVQYQVSQSLILTAVFIAAFSACCVPVAGRALAAAIKLQDTLRDEPVS
jgi:hypothetical protein